MICLILYDGAHSYSIFGGNIVAPVVASVMSYTLPYIGVEAVYSDDEMETVDVYEPWLTTISLTNAKAYQYLRQYKGLDFLTKHYGVEHTQSIEDAVEDIAIICNRHGGALAL